MPEGEGATTEGPPASDRTLLTKLGIGVSVEFPIGEEAEVIGGNSSKEESSMDVTPILMGSGEK
ncbi:hypothetical protein RND71_021619 [Anisodus tanguticus]|uniref:Uncharacterized protein n=1 Tax=Anisodus tanguticus TaxID=243964 RepID=A0AAE1RWP8_9SOLA|nr:hypothetical protein RND71_021619 [Anisodus tanguticus]